MASHLRPSIVLLGAFTLITGIVYPLVVTAVAQLVFPHQAGGSLIVEEGRIVGSRLIAQPFDDPGLFWSRPSATSPGAYDAASSGGSNLGPGNPALVSRVKAGVAALRAADRSNAAPVPVDLVTASGSGLDPHLTPAAALYQAGRVARARGLDVERVVRLIDDHTGPRELGFLGEPRVNVLELNLALRRLH